MLRGRRLVLVHSGMRKSRSIQAECNMYLSMKKQNAAELVEVGAGR